MVTVPAFPSIFRFGTGVVEDTVIGAIPVGAIEFILYAVTGPVPCIVRPVDPSLTAVIFCCMEFVTKLELPEIDPLICELNVLVP